METAPTPPDKLLWLSIRLCNRAHHGIVAMHMLLSVLIQAAVYGKFWVAEMP